MSFVEDALKFHAEHNGMLATASKVPLNNREDLALAYTPGVAEPCKAIKENKELSFEYTCRGNTVAIVSDGTRVLGLGDIGPEAAMPVMEGKAVLFKPLATLTPFLSALTPKTRKKLLKRYAVCSRLLQALTLKIFLRRNAMKLKTACAKSATFRYSTTTSTAPPLRAFLLLWALCVM